MNWEWTASNAGLRLRHHGLNCEITDWSGQLRYVDSQDPRTRTLELAPGPSQSPTVRLRGRAPALSAEVRLTAGTSPLIGGTVRSTSRVELDRLVLSARARLGASARRCAFFKNGYQSWTQTRSFSRGDREQLPLLRFLTVMQDNGRNTSSRAGGFASDMFGVLGNLAEKRFLLVGQLKGFRQFVYITVTLAHADCSCHVLRLIYDFGGQALEPQAEVDLDDVVLLADDHANRLQDAYFDAVGRTRAPSRALPTGWCSWYYYYAKVAAKDISENLKVIRERQVGWQYMVLDDGYEAAVGDWLAANNRFPEGLAAVADEMRASGMVPGLWVAPFIAQRSSRLFREHPEWVLRDDNGRPLLAGWVPAWGLDGRFYGLDTTHPDFQAQLRDWIDTIVHKWGFGYLKLDFTYGACLCGRAFDPTLSSAQRLTLGYQTIRDVAGDHAFILGCGSPLSPAIGWVDAMRIGPDVAPYWFAKYRYHLTRDPHALCTKFAIRSILNRCQMHRRLWINDPDCLLLREAETKLTLDERMSLANAVIITGGMYMISDRLQRLAPSVWDRLNAIVALVQECDRGRAWPIDYMEREIPELVYNSAGYLAAFNFEDRSVAKGVSLYPELEEVVDSAALLADVWSGETLAADGGRLDLGRMAPHSSRLLRIQLD